MPEVDKPNPPASESEGAGEVPSPPAPLETETPASKEAPVEDWATRFKYLLAEFENFRRRSEREREVAHREATASFLRRLIPLYEAFLHARKTVDKLPEEDALRRGLDLVHKEWEAIFQREGFVPVARP
ncbi:MAG: nucleotide exchange factor GrpE, partial [Thermoplasmata archaeon]|nr:nucleotide exchange factor GrpE [Thermoplasmata archaeon]